MDSISAPASEAPPKSLGALQRMIRTREAAPTLDVSPRPERAAMTALGRAAERMHQLPIYVEKVDFGTISVSELTEHLPEHAMLAVVEGARDQLGVVALSPAFLASLIEMQALGRVTTRPVQARRPTRTDAVISQGFVNALLAELAAEMPAPQAELFRDCRYLTFVEGARPLSLMLEDTALERLSLRFRIGSGGQRDAVIEVVMPALPAPAAAALPQPLLQMEPHLEPCPAGSGPALASTVRDVPIVLRAVLCRKQMQLSALRRLGPGSVISLPQNALDDTAIETASGQVLARGRLGEADGFHAIRLNGQSHGQPPKQMSEIATADPLEQSHSLPISDADQPDPFRSHFPQVDGVAV